MKSLLFLPLALLLAGCKPTLEAHPTKPNLLPAQHLTSDTLEQTPVDPEKLWLKAVVLAENNAAYVPGQIVEEEAYFDSKGSLEEQWSLHTGLRRQANGEIDWYLIKATENDKDVMAQYEREFAKEAAQSQTTEQSDEAWFDDEDMVLAYPFAASQQAAITLHGSEGTEVLDGQTYQRVAYSHKVEEITWTGVAWLHTKSGLPLKIELTRPVPFEDKESEVTIQQVSVAINYHATPTAWYPLEILTEAAFKVEGFLYRYKGRSVSTTRLSEYWHWDD